MYVCSAEEKNVKSFHSLINGICTEYFFFVVSDLDSTGGAGVCKALILADKLEKQTFEQEQKTQMHASI